MATYSETAFASQLPFLFIMQKKKSKVIIGNKITDLTGKEKPGKSGLVVTVYLCWEKTIFIQNDQT